MKDEDLEIGMKAKAKLMESIMGQFSFARGSEELSEDIQTPERAAEMKKMIAKAERKSVRAADKALDRPSKKNEKGYDDAFQNEVQLKRDNKLEKLDRMYVYGKGGKPFVKRSKAWIPVKSKTAKKGK